MTSTLLILLHLFNKIDSYWSLQKTNCRLTMADCNRGAKVENKTSFFRESTLCITNVQIDNKRNIISITKTHKQCKKIYKQPEMIIILDYYIDESSSTTYIMCTLFSDNAYKRIKVHRLNELKHTPLSYRIARRQRIKNHAERTTQNCLKRYILITYNPF